MTPRDVVRLPILAAQIWSATVRREWARARIRRLERRLAKSELARFGRVLTDDERRERYS